MVPVHPFIVLLGELWNYSEQQQQAGAHGAGSTAAEKGAAAKKPPRSLLRLCCSGVLTISIVVGFSRSLALWRYYGEPDRAAAWLYRHIISTTQQQQQQKRSVAATNGGALKMTPPPALVNVCVGKEWFRFPPAYFLPNNARLVFVESRSFSGALPRDFVEGRGFNGTCAQAGPMNDLNRAEPGQAIPRDLVRARCDYIFDTTLGDGGQELRDAAESDDGSGPLGAPNRPLSAARSPGAKRGSRVIYTGEMLDASKTPAWARVLYVPVWGEKMGRFAHVVVAELEE